MIALLNGNFVAGGTSVILLLEAVRELEHLIHAYADASDLLAATGDSDTDILFRAVDAAGSLTAHSHDRGVQPPVALRDARPAVSFILEALRGLTFAIERTLDRQSGNPLFVFDESVRACEQSSFLDFKLTAAITTTVQAMHLGAGLWQRIILHSAAQQEPASVDGQRFVQPPKVADAVLERMYLEQGIATRFTGSDSKEIEDLRDLSLASALQGLRTVAYLGELRMLAEGVGVSASFGAEFSRLWWEVATRKTATPQDVDMFNDAADMLRRI